MVVVGGSRWLGNGTIHMMLSAGPGASQVPSYPGVGGRH